MVSTRDVHAQGEPPKIIQAYKFVANEFELVDIDGKTVGYFTAGGRGTPRLVLCSPGDGTTGGASLHLTCSPTLKGTSMILLFDGKSQPRVALRSGTGDYPSNLILAADPGMEKTEAGIKLSTTGIAGRYPEPNKGSFFLGQGENGDPLKPDPKGQVGFTLVGSDGSVLIQQPQGK